MSLSNANTGTLGFVRSAVVAVLLGSACGGATDAARAVPEGTPPSGPGSPSGRDVLAVVAGNELRLIRLDGTERTALAGDPLLGGISGADLVGGGRFLVVRAYAESDPASGLRLALVGSDGAVKWRQSFAVSFAGGAGDDALRWGISLGEDGSVVFDDRITTSFHVESTGALQGSLAGFFPVGRALDGFLPVRSAWSASQPYSVTYGFWKLGSADLANVTRSEAQTGFDAIDSVSFAGKMLRLASRDGVVLLLESASGTDTIALPQATDQARIGAHASDEMFASDERWLLVASGVPGRVLRVDLRSKAVEALDLVAPDGYRPYASCRDGASLDGGLQIDRDGKLVASFRNDDHVAAFATMDGAHWSKVGGSFSGVGGFDVRVERGTYVVSGHTGAYCYGPGPTWTTTTNADFVGNAAELVRPSAGAHLAAASASAFAWVLSRSGRYGARWDVDKVAGTASLRVTDIETGTERTVAVDASGVRSAEPVWLWEP